MSSNRRAPRASAARKSTHAGGSFRTSFCRTRSGRHASINAVSSSPGMPLEIGPRALHERADAGIHHRRWHAGVGAEAGEQHVEAAESPARLGHRAKVLAVGLIVREDEAAEAMAREALHDLDDHVDERGPRERHRAGPALGERARSIGQGGRQDHAVSRACQMRRDTPRELLRAEPVHEQRQMRAVLLHRAQREDDQRPLVVREPRDLGPRALGEADHGRAGFPLATASVW